MTNSSLDSSNNCPRFPEKKFSYENAYLQIVFNAVVFGRLLRNKHDYLRIMTNLVLDVIHSQKRFDLHTEWR